MGHQMFAKYFKDFTRNSKKYFPQRTLTVKVNETYLKYYNDNTNKWKNGQKRNDFLGRKCIY